MCFWVHAYHFIAVYITPTLRHPKREHDLYQNINHHSLYVNKFRISPFTMRTSTRAGNATFPELINHTHWVIWQSTPNTGWGVRSLGHKHTSSNVAESERGPRLSDASHWCSAAKPYQQGAHAVTWENKRQSRRGLWDACGLSAVVLSSAQCLSISVLISLAPLHLSSDYLQRLRPCASNNTHTQRAGATLCTWELGPPILFY